MPSYIGAIDQGTTSPRFSIFDSAENIVPRRRRNTNRFIPKPDGWNTIRKKYGGSLRKLLRAPCDKRDSILKTSPRSESQTKEKRQWFGIARRASPCTTRLSGKILAWKTPSQNSPVTAVRIGSG